MASGALKGALIGAATGVVGGGMKSAMDYYEEHGTVDGSGSQILSGSAQGFAAGAVTGAASGAMAGVGKYHKNPKGYCFIAGTLVLTAVGLVSIENIQPGDQVYAKEAVGEERFVDLNQEVELRPVLDTFVHEVDDTYIVTIDDEEIETTGDHPFYDEDGNVVEAKDLQEGDKLPTYDGETAIVESVEHVHHDKPVKVYNFCVMEDHTYFIGNSGVLVHNSDCDKSELNSLEKKLSDGMASNVGRNSSGVASGGENLTSVNRMMHGSQGNVGVMPKEIADRMRGRQYNNFDSFREDFWNTVADSSYSSEFSKSNIARMRQGLAPRVVKEQRYGGNISYILHHKTPIHAGGGVYDLGNISILTPRMHQEILDKSYHFGH